MSFINSSWWLVPLIITIFSGILCPAMGTVLITHRRLLQVNLISHCVLPGLALALALGIHPSIGGVISGLLGSVIAESLTNKKSENYEAIMNTIYRQYEKCRANVKKLRRKICVKYEGKTTIIGRKNKE